MGQRLSARVSPIFRDIEGRKCDPPQVIVCGTIFPAPSIFGRWWVGKETTRVVVGTIPIALDTMMLFDLCLRHRSVANWW